MPKTKKILTQKQKQAVVININLPKKKKSKNSKTSFKKPIQYPNQQSATFIGSTEVKRTLNPNSGSVSLHTGSGVVYTNQGNHPLIQTNPKPVMIDSESQTIYTGVKDRPNMLQLTPEELMRRQLEEDERKRQVRMRREEASQARRPRSGSAGSIWKP